MPQLPEALSQAGLQFAVATEEDFDEIMAMSQDIYGGLDYLPTRYTSWLQETNRTVILARKQGKVVSPMNNMKIFLNDGIQRMQNSCILEAETSIII